jgi:organic radical activating enzyme
MIEFDTHKQIPVMEHFFTLQGEGNFAGNAAYFIRLAGCDVGCTWCDVKESWDVKKEQLIDIKSIVSIIKSYNSPIVVITGGEPTIYNLHPFTKMLKENNIRVHIETAGVYPLQGNFDWICLSPKKFKKPLEENYILAHELKVIVYHPSDLKWAEQEALKTNKDCILYLQPEWSIKEKLLPLVIEYIKNNPHWRLSLQTHKYIDIP